MLALSILPALHLTGCGGKKIDDSDPRALFKDAEEDVKDKRYTMALEKFKVLKNKFPYSHLATEATLRIGDVYYMEESYIEAAGAYESFRDMHPKNEKADYVLFRIGESYYNQLPSNDRDLSTAAKGIDAYRELLGLYPQSQYAADAQKHMTESVEKLADKEKYIGDFYFKRGMYDSASGRYEKITSKFPGTVPEQYAYWSWGQSLIKESKVDEAKHVYRVYISRFPSGTYAKLAGDWLDKNGGR
jgi:outer membrane protein assembly factor BamD